MILDLDRRAVIVWSAAFSLVGSSSSASTAPSTLIRRGDRLFVPAKVNGVEVEGMLDSAAETTLLSPAFASRLGIGGGQQADAHGSGASAMSARLVDHVRIEAAGVEVRDTTVAIIDLGDVSRRLTGRPIDVVVGREIFDAARLRIDIGHGTIGQVAQEEHPSGVELPLQDERGLMLMPVSIEGRAPVGAEFDLGNGTGMILSRRYAMRVGLFDGRALTSTLGGGLGGAKPRQGFVVRNLSVAGRSFPNVHVDIDDAPDAHDANIGVGILQHFRITTDFADHKLWLEAE